MINDNGIAQLDAQTWGDVDNYRYLAPETQFPKDYSSVDPPNTVEKDVFGMGMIAYEASSLRP